MKRIHGLLSGLAAGLLLCACGAGEAGDSDTIGAPAPTGDEDRASEQTESAQTAAVVIPSCTTACTKVSTSNLTGACCICNGVQKTFHRSVVNQNVYLCQ